MVEEKNNYYFSVGDKQLLYLGIPLNEIGLIEQAKGVLDKLTLPGRLLKEEGFSEDALRMCWISLAFCIANQGQSFERPVKFSRDLCKYGLEEVQDDEFVHAKGLENSLLWPENRYKPAFDFLKSYSGGAAQFSLDYLVSPLEKRDELTGTKWINNKTASFWYLCLGGDQLLTIDRHLFRQLSGLGISVSNPHLYIPKLRKNGKSKGKSVIVSSSPEEYERVERDALEFLLQFPEFLSDGRVDGALATSVFWTAGAEARRKGNFYLWRKRMDNPQTDLFPEPPRNGSLKFDSPFLISQ